MSSLPLHVGANSSLHLVQTFSFCHVGAICEFLSHKLLRGIVHAGFFDSDSELVSEEIYERSLIFLIYRTGVEQLFVESSINRVEYHRTDHLGAYMAGNVPFCILSAMRVMKIV